MTTPRDPHHGQNTWAALRHGAGPGSDQHPAPPATGPGEAQGAPAPPYGGPSTGGHPAPPGPPAGAGLPVEAPPTPLGPLPYHQGLRRHTGNAWRGILALVLLAVVFFAAQIPVTVIMLMESGWDLQSVRLTPLAMIAMNLALGALWPASLLIQRILYGPRPGTLHSITGRIRWRLFGSMCAVLLPAYAIYVGITPFIMPEESGPFTATMAAFLIVGLLTTPLQSAGEEVAFRGLLPRAVGGWFANPRVALTAGTVVSSIFFALAHGAGDMWLNSYYLVFAVALTVMTWRTQGLEAAIIAHAANNTFLMVLNSAQGVDFEESLFERQAGVGGPFMLVAMAMCIVVTALVWWRTSKPKVAAQMQIPEPVKATL
ncbi:MAG TPA: type II CAAX endopeptidase family protein [Beutenbergiaceae bacterium]|nr:type II CAAX endopeptidase family protein [Beutenbergiaceae bacterium]